MAYPNATEISNAASTLGVDPIEVYAYAALHGALPANNGSLSDLQTRVAGYYSNPPFSPAYTYGFIESHGRYPSSNDELGAWLLANNFMDASNHPTTNAPFAGLGYPPGGQATDAVPSSASTAPAPSPGLFSGLQLDGKTILIGAAVLGAGWYAFGRHR